MEVCCRRRRSCLKAVSAAPLDRMPSPVQAEVPRRLCGTRRCTPQRPQSPVQGEVREEKRAGFLEAGRGDHGGSSRAGDFIWSLTCPSLGRGWTEGRAVWNKGAPGVLKQTRDAEKNRPFPLLGMDFDKGGEWLNGHLAQYLQERVAPVKRTRPRPCPRDDPAGAGRTWSKRTGWGRARFWDGAGWKSPGRRP